MLSYKLLDKDTWDDFEDLFGRHNGVRGGCWCMFHRMRASHFAKASKEERRTAQKELACNGRGCGLIIYEDDFPVAWCQVGKAEEFPQYDFGKDYSMLDIDKNDKPDWRISCMFVDKNHRKQKIASYALDSALDYIKESGGGVVEAFPKNTAKSGAPAYAGSKAMFEKRGFMFVSQLGTHTYLMRKRI